MSDHSVASDVSGPTYDQIVKLVRDDGTTRTRSSMPRVTSPSERRVTAKLREGCEGVLTVVLPLP